MKAKIKLGGREVVIEDLKKASGLKKYTGLMFRKNSPALLFEFPSYPKAIHSFFCYPFIAIWLLNEKVQECRIIKPWKSWILPEKEFNKLIEIPLNEKYAETTNFLFDKFGKKENSVIKK